MWIPVLQLDQASEDLVDWDSPQLVDHIPRHVFSHAATPASPSPRFASLSSNFESLLRFSHFGADCVCFPVQLGHSALVSGIASVPETFWRFNNSACLIRSSFASAASLGTPLAARSAATVVVGGWMLLGGRREGVHSTPQQQHSHSHRHTQTQTQSQTQTKKNASE